MKKIALKIGNNHTISYLVQELLDCNYEKVDDVVRSGQFSNRGDIITVFPVNLMMPIRVDFFGNQIESIVAINLSTKIAVAKLDEITVAQNAFVAKGSLVCPENYVVHEDHGIGVFSHLETRNIGNNELLYIVINYLNNDVLRVPTDQVEKISYYIGVGRRRPKLNKLGTDTWKKTYHKTYENIIQMAKELLEIYATREIVKRMPYKINTEWNQIISSNFGFVETADQQAAINDTLNDLRSDKPMDRLVCGDVGFGKTEVAIRALIQAVANGEQVVFLVPTTILAEQHYQTLVQRFEKLPIQVARLSRFVSGSEAIDAISRLESGQVDVLIATHSVLRTKINFKKLGMLIIDEEQKFGVRDKEKIKQNHQDLHVLTLTATPIPRTLFMSLSGLRDISQISSIPSGRQAIETRAEIFDEKSIHNYIQREINRSGQVYYLHNRVSSITGTARKLQKMFPSLRIEIAHGQMSEIQLSKVMSAFSNGEIDVLVCSTIIENGLDLPNVNTLIVEESDRFGLSQLYQIRGRIGRSKIQSYALFTYSNKKLTLNAVKRLKAIVEKNELGFGFDIALEDLEIRGGGNILGRDQHGNMETVGIVLYTKLLKLAIEKIKQS